MRRLRGLASIVIAIVAPIALALASKASAGSADAPTVHLSWVRAQGAEGCIDRETLAHDVNVRLGRDAFGGAPTRSIEGIVAREGNKWVARLYVRDAAGALAGDRELTSEAPDCKALSSAVTLAIALVIDPEAAFAPPPPPSASTSASASAVPSASASVAPPPIASASSVAIVPTAPPVVAVAHPPIAEARFGITTGLVPKVAPVALLGLEGTTTIHPRVLAMLVPGTRVDDGSVGFGLTAANVGACGSFASDADVSLSACVGAVGGVIHAYVYGLQPVTPGDRAWLGASTGLDGTLRIVGPVRLVFGVEAIWPITRHRFLAEGRTEPLFRQPFVTMLASLGLGLAFR